MLVFLSCVGTDLKNNSLQSKFNDAKNLLNLKSSQSKRTFQYIIFNNPGSSIAQNLNFI